MTSIEQIKQPSSHTNLALEDVEETSKSGACVTSFIVIAAITFPTLLVVLLLSGKSFVASLVLAVSLAAPVAVGLVLMLRIGLRP